LYPIPVSSQVLACLFVVACVSWGMSGSNVSTILKKVEDLLSQAGSLPAEAEQAIAKLLNVVEALSADRSELAREVERLRRQLELKKKPKTTDSTDQDDHNTKNGSDHSSEKRRESKRGRSYIDKVG